jgi:uncharacterized membrane protein YkvA (DUF1232 family)
MVFEGIVAALLVLLTIWLLLVVLLWLHRPARDQIGPVMRLGPDLARLAWSVLRDPGTPRSVRAALAFLAIWLASPIDPIPDFLPLIGWLDDVVVAVVVLRWAARRVGEATLERHWRGSPEGWRLVVRLL